MIGALRPPRARPEVRPGRPVRPGMLCASGRHEFFACSYAFAFASLAKGNPAVRRYYPLVTNSVLTMRLRGDIVLHVRPPSPFGFAGGSTVATGRQGERVPASVHWLSE